MKCDFIHVTGMLKNQFLKLKITSNQNFGRQIGTSHIQLHRSWPNGVKCRTIDWKPFWLGLVILIGSFETTVITNNKIFKTLLYYIKLQLFITYDSDVYNKLLQHIIFAKYTSYKKIWRMWNIVTVKKRFFVSTTLIHRLCIIHSLN